MPRHYLKQCWHTVDWTLGINFSAIAIEINTFLFKKMHLKMLSAKWRLFHLSLYELIHGLQNIIFSWIDLITWFWNRKDLSSVVTLHFHNNRELLHFLNNNIVMSFLTKIVPEMVCSDIALVSYLSMTGVVWGQEAIWRPGMHQQLKTKMAPGPESNLKGPGGYRVWFIKFSIPEICL